MAESAEKSKELSLENIVTNVVQIPGVKVDRKKFLADQFSSSTDLLQVILESGPIEAGIEQDRLKNMANKLIMTRTSQSSLASFAAGIPGGLAMAATIPADIMQFFGMSLRLAQELSYLYGARDLWKDGEIDDERVRNQLLLYCGVMFGVSSAAAGVRVLSTQIAKTVLKKLPQKALTKTFWYPLIKQIGKALSIKVTKTTVAHGFSKAIPVLGGVISGGLNFASMLPMAKRLLATLDEANFGYTEEELQADLEAIENLEEVPEAGTADTGAKAAEIASGVKDKFSKGFKSVESGISGLFGAKAPKQTAPAAKPEQADEDIFGAIEKLAKLKEMGALTEEEFTAKKAELLSRL